MPFNPFSKSNATYFIVLFCLASLVSSCATTSPLMHQPRYNGSLAKASSAATQPPLVQQQATAPAPIIQPAPKPVMEPAPVPVKPAPVPAFVHRSDVYHEVGPLESIWRLSKMYDVSQESILRANGMNTTNLEVGQKLLIPNAAPIMPVIPLYENTKWRYIVIHHTASDIGNAKMVHQWHHNRGFTYGLGYHFLIDNGTAGKKDGQIEISPRWIRQEDGAHCKAADMNKKAIGVSLVGNFSKNHVSQDQFDSLVFLVRELMSFYRIPASRIIRHRDAKGARTECPGTKFPWRDFKASL